MQYLSQRDPRWSQTKIGKTQRTIGQVGCTIDCLSMISDYFGEFKNPAEIAKTLQFTSDARIMWGSIANAFKKFKFNFRNHKRDDALIHECITNPDKACMIEVDYGSHWIVPIHDPSHSTDYLCVDPITGKIRLAIGDFVNITGVAWFSRVK